MSEAGGLTGTAGRSTSTSEKALGPAISESVSAGRTIVAGDFNQRLPRSRQPLDAAHALTEALGSLRVATAGDQPVVELIDHVALSPDMSVQEVVSWSNVIDGERTSDHSGVAVTITQTITRPTYPRPILTTRLIGAASGNRSSTGLGSDPLAASASSVSSQP